MRGRHTHTDLTLAIVALALLAAACVDDRQSESPGPLVGRILDARDAAYAQDHTPRLIDVTDLVREYVPLGTASAAALSTLRSNGFAVAASGSAPEVAPGMDERYLATYDTRSEFASGFGDVIEVRIGIRDGRVAWLSARIIYLHL